MESQSDMRTPAWAHQRAAFERSRDAAAFALLFEQRCGKTRVVLETAAHLFRRGAVDGLLVLCPNGLQRVWLDQAAEHYAPTFPHRGVAYRSTAAALRASAELLAFPGLALLAVNVEALISPRARRLVETFLERRRCLLALDESDVCKSPGAKRTRIVATLARRAPYRRILTGTPVAEGPLDAYSQFKILDPALLGFTSYYAFRARYARFEDGYDPRAGRRFPKLVGYQNVDELQAKIAAASVRVTRAEVSDAPPKVYGKRYFELTPRQRVVYDALRDRYVAELASGARIAAPNVLARYVRLQQVSSNIAVSDGALCTACDGLGCDACDGLGATPTVVGPVDPERNPRLEAALEAVATSPGPHIVWCRFDADVDAVVRASPGAVRYDGRVNDRDRAAAVAAFREGRASVFVSKPSAGGRGLPLEVASTIINVSHYFSLRLRLQSEDRAEALGKSLATGVVDVVGEGTVDERVVAALRAKRTLSDLITGDDPREWI